MEIGNSTLLITGATAENGIGMALARRFQQRGSTVIVSGRSQWTSSTILDTTHPELDTIFLDVTNPDSIAAASASLRETHPELDAVITMAGMMAPEDVHDPASLSTAEDIIVTNLLGTIRTIRAFLPQLLEQPAATIITVGSGLGFVPRADVPSYSASKAAVRSYTDAIRVQLAASGVEVMLLTPPAVRTSLMHQEHLERAMPVDDYADEVMTILADEPDADEILVDRVKPLRFAEANGTYHQLMQDAHLSSGALTGAAEIELLISEDRVR